METPRPSPDRGNTKSNGDFPDPYVTPERGVSKPQQKGCCMDKENVAPCYQDSQSDHQKQGVRAGIRKPPIRGNALLQQLTEAARRCQEEERTPTRPTKATHHVMEGEEGDNETEEEYHHDEAKQTVAQDKARLIEEQDRRVAKVAAARRSQDSQVPRHRERSVSAGSYSQPRQPDCGWSRRDSYGSTRQEQYEDERYVLSPQSRAMHHKVSPRQEHMLVGWQVPKVHRQHQALPQAVQVRAQEGKPQLKNNVPQQPKAQDKATNQTQNTRPPTPPSRARPKQRRHSNWGMRSQSRPKESYTELTDHYNPLPNQLWRARASSGPGSALDSSSSAPSANNSVHLTALLDSDDLDTQNDPTAEGKDPAIVGGESHGEADDPVKRSASSRSPSPRSGPFFPRPPDPIEDCLFRPNRSQSYHPRYPNKPDASYEDSLPGPDADTRIICRDEVAVKAHSVVLCLKSPILKQKINDTEQQNGLYIFTMDTISVVAKLFVASLLNQLVLRDAKPEYHAPLLELYQRYEVKECENYCTELMVAQLQRANRATMYQYAAVGFRYQRPDLLRAALDAIDTPRHGDAELCVHWEVPREVLLAVLKTSISSASEDLKSIFSNQHHFQDYPPVPVRPYSVQYGSYHGAVLGIKSVMEPNHLLVLFTHVGELAMIVPAEECKRL